MQHAPLLRYEQRVYRAAQQRRAIKFTIVTCGWLLAGFGIGALYAHGPVALAGGLFIGAIIGYLLHALTRPML